jgi:type II secretory pathway predicted ATPase ExeA
MPRHFLELDTATIQTPSFKLAQRNVRDVVDAGAIGLFFGDAGTGKTYAVEEGLETVELPTHWFTFPLRTTPRALVNRLLDLITGVPHQGTQARLEPLLIEALSEQLLVATIDEAQHLNYPCVEELRHLHDHPGTRFALLLVGGDGCSELIRQYPMLSSRIARWTKFSPLNVDEVVRFLPEFHWLYRGADPKVIEDVDDRYAEGNLRRWACFTDAARRLAEGDGVDSLTEPIAKAALYLVGGDLVAA